MLTAQDITMLLLSLGVMLAAARVFGEVARRFGQPSIVGEIAAGVLLGPTILGRLVPGIWESLFPTSGSGAAALQAFIAVSITLFMLVAGMEVDLRAVWRKLGAASAIGLGGALPAMVGGGLLALLYPQWMGMGEGVAPESFVLFVATAFGLSGLAVIAKMLMDVDLSRTDLGATILASAVLIDVAGCFLFALVLALAEGSGGDRPHANLEPWQTMVAAGLFVVAWLTIGRAALNKAIPWVQAHTAWPGGVLGLALIGCVLCAAFTEWAGVHAIIGAFVFGMVLGDSRHLRHSTRTTLDQFISFIFAPLFFASIGLRVDLATAFDPLLVGVVLVVAAVTKIGGCTLTARVTRHPWRESLAIGLAMNARGSVDVILGLLALEVGIISERLFVALMIHALVALAVSGALMQRAMKRKVVVRFTAYGTAKTFRPSLEAPNRTAALDLLSRSTATGAGLNPEVVRDAIIARDLLVRSAVGRGVAVAHARLTGLERPVVGVGISPEPIAWNATDGQGVRLVIVMLTPEEDARMHLELLASIARSMRDPSTIEALLTAKSWTEFLAAITAGQGEAADRDRKAHDEKRHSGE